MNFKTTLVLAIVLLLVGAAVLWVNFNSDKESPPVDETTATLLKLTSSEVKKVVIQPADGQTLAFEKEGGNWRMVEPIKAATNSFDVDQLVSGLTGLKSRAEIEPGEYASVSLDKPQYTITLTTNTGQTKILRIGKHQTVGDNLYVLVEGNAKGTVVAGDITQQLQKSPNDFREKKLVSANATDIKQIEIDGENGKIALQKTGDNWEMTEPQKMPAESSDVSSMTSAVSFLNASSFVDESNVNALLDPKTHPKTTIWFSTSAAATQPTTAPRITGTTIKVGDYDSVLKKNVYVWVSEPPTLAKVSATTFDAFNKKPYELRDRKVVDIDPATVTHITIASDLSATTQPTAKPASASTITLDRKKISVTLGPEAPTTSPGKATTKATTKPTTEPALPPSNWTLLQASPTDADQSRVEAMLDKLHPLRADKYLESAPKDSKPVGRYSIRVSTESAAKSAQYEIRLSDMGDDKPLIGEYGGLVFELPHSLLQDCTGDFKNKPKAPELPTIPSSPPPFGGQ